MTQIAPQPGIMEIDLYQGGAAHVAGLDNVVKLSSNENPLGPSPAAVEAYRRAAYDLHRYPSSDHSALRAAIAEVQAADFGVGYDRLAPYANDAVFLGVFRNRT